MKNYASKILLLLMLPVIFQIFVPDFAPKTFAATSQGVKAGGRGISESAAVEDMAKSVLKRILATITARSDDPSSPYQKILARYKNFVEEVKVEQRGKNSVGAFVTGKVKINYLALKDELLKLVKNSYANDEDGERTVYLFIRIVGASNEESLAAENIVRQKYLANLRANKFVIANPDEDMTKTRSMNFEQFVEFVKRSSEENPEVSTAIVGEITAPKISTDSDGVTGSCDIRIRALDCFNGYRVIENYEGGDVLRVNDINKIGTLTLEKVALTSSKAIIDKLMTYWSN